MTVPPSNCPCKLRPVVANLYLKCDATAPATSSGASSMVFGGNYSNPSDSQTVLLPAPGEHFHEERGDNAGLIKVLTVTPLSRVYYTPS
jgi:hypothetical protein